MTDSNEEDIVIEPDAESDNLRDPAEAVKKLKEELKLCKKERAEYLSGWQRAQADYANLRKEGEQARREFAKFAQENLIGQILPAMQSFHMAFGNKEAWEKVDLNWRMGVQYIYSQLLGVLEQNGVTLIEPKVGEKFDPLRHATIGSVPTGKKEEDHTVKEVVQKGFALHGKVLEPAKVKIGEYAEKN